jgi:hypothetical protein
MPKTYRHLLIPIHAFMVLMLCVGPAVGQKLLDDLLKQRLTVKRDDVTFINVIATLSGDHRIPIGVELGTISYDGVRKNFDSTDETLEDTLNLTPMRFPAGSPCWTWRQATGATARASESSAKPSPGGCLRGFG